MRSPDDDRAADEGRPGRAPAAAIADLLATGEVDVKGRIPWSSNATFLVGLTRPQGDEPASALAVYKPERGERPLRDFERGLWRREVAAYQLSEYLGWELVPVTVARLDGPLGHGSLQLFVEAEEEHYFTLLEHEAYLPQLRRMAVFDVVANNADRKGGHCLLDADGHIWGIDNGLTFHTDPKLRTVIWDFAGQRLDDDVLDDLASLARGQVPEPLSALLHPDELEALVARAGALGQRRKLPRPVGDFAYPWPLI